jgi:hypothetical protein
MARYEAAAHLLSPKPLNSTKVLLWQDSAFVVFHTTAMGKELATAG